MNLHLAEISTQVAPGALAAVICDGAGWQQTGGGLKLPGNIVLIPLPPYSPELNSMENVWEYCGRTGSPRAYGTAMTRSSMPL
jgi:transposase